MPYIFTLIVLYLVQGNELWWKEIPHFTKLFGGEYLEPMYVLLVEIDRKRGILSL